MFYPPRGSFRMYLIVNHTDNHVREWSLIMPRGVARGGGWKEINNFVQKFHTPLTFSSKFLCPYKLSSNIFVPQRRSIVQKAPYAMTVGHSPCQLGKGGAVSLRAGLGQSPCWVPGAKLQLTPPVPS